MTSRLQHILSAVDTCQTLADVGCDHGYIGIGALENGTAQNVIFVDVSAPSLQKARQNCPQKFEKNASFVCTNGLCGITCDQAVIAGMGGLEIVDILQNAEHLPERLVLQPMKNTADVRKFLCNGYSILTDYKFYEAGIFYDLIVAKRSAGEQLSADQIAYGKTNLTDFGDDFVAYLQQQKQMLSAVFRDSGNASVKVRLDDVERILHQKETKK